MNFDACSAGVSAHLAELADLPSQRAKDAAQNCLALGFCLLRECEFQIPQAHAAQPAQQHPRRCAQRRASRSRHAARQYPHRSGHHLQRQVLQPLTQTDLSHRHVLNRSRQQPSVYATSAPNRTESDAFANRKRDGRSHPSPLQPFPIVDLTGRPWTLQSTERSCARNYAHSQGSARRRAEPRRTEHHGHTPGA